MKRICSLLCAAALGLSGTAAVFPAGLTAFAEEDAPTSGTCGENLTWTLDGEGTLTISGSGEMQDYPYSTPENEYYYAPWSDFTEQIKTVTLSDGVTSIGNSAFYVCVNLTAVTLPDSVTRIGNAAFLKCTSLSAITIPGNVTSIEDFAFHHCTDLTEIIIPDSVTSIGAHAFFECTGLTSITIPTSITSIGEDAFAGCESLTIKGYAGSTAEAYAKENNIPFIGLDDAPAFITSDLTGDGAADVADAVLYARALAEDAAADLKNPLPDLNGDGLITLLDLRALLRSL